MRLNSGLFHPRPSVDDVLIEYCRTLEAPDVAEALGLPSARERYKYACPCCGSSDALHCWPGGGRFARCYSCQTGYDAIKLVELATGQEFKPAVQWLAEEFGFAKEVSEHRVDHRQRIREQIEERREERERRQRERHQDARPIYEDIYRRLTLGPTARDYLTDRGIPWEVARELGIRSVGTDDQWERIRSEYWPDDLKRAGLTGAQDGESYPVPWRTPFLVFPYYQDTGALDILRFRHLEGGEPRYLSPIRLYPTGPFLSHSYELADDHDELFVCEGELDAVSVVYGANAPAIASPGNGCWEPEWSKRFRWWDRVTVLCDGDEAGRQFAQNVREATSEALGDDWAEQRLGQRVFADGLDANDCLQSGDLKDVIHAA